MADAESGWTADRERVPSSVTNALNSRYAMCIEAVVTVALIIACAVVLAISGDEEPHKPLRAWVIVSLCALVASLLLLCFRKNEAEPSTQAIMQGLLPNEFERSNSGSPAAVDCFKWLLDCFSLAWFIVGYVWIFCGTSSRSVAPHLYWMTFAILIVYVSRYAMKFLICSACSCFLCILGILGTTSRGSSWIPDLPRDP